MPTKTIFVDSITPQPLSIPGGQATVTFTVTGTYTGTIEILATPVGGGTPVVVGSLTINQGGGNRTYTETIDLDTSALDPNTSYNFSAQDPNNGLTSGNTIGPVEVICFYPGTLIATPAGDRAVETLAMGDLVLTHEGQAQRIRWMGRQTVSTRFGDPLRILPIRIKAGALADGLPARDLLLSPDHAVLVEGVLIQAGALVNGTTILREFDVPEVFTYYHIELDRHDLILAEGTPAETFVDNIDRLSFDNWSEHEALYGNEPSIREMALPRAKAERQVPRFVRATLEARAGILRAA